MTVNLWNEILLSDDQLLFCDVSADVDDLHPVSQRLRDGLGRVGRADEQNSGQVDRHVQVVVEKRRVLNQLNKKISFFILIIDVLFKFNESDFSKSCEKGRW